MSTSISFVLPTKNEEHSIGQIIDGIRDESARLDLEIHEIIIVDDSSDQTADVAQKAGAKVVPGGRVGLGTAMMKGLQEASSYNSDVIVSLDSDGQVDLAELKDFIQPVISGSHDMVIGSRFLEEGLLKYSYPFINRQGVRILSLILRLFTGLPITDSHGGIRAMSTSVAQQLEILGHHTYVQETIIDACRKGFRIVEIPSSWLERKKGRSRVVRSIPLYIFKTLPVLLKRVFS